MKTTKPIYLLILGTVLIALTHLRFGFGFLIFLESIPILIYLDRTKRLRSHLLLFAFLFIGWSLSISKIITEPLPWFAIFGFSLPITLFKYLPFLGYSFIKKYRYSEWSFPALMVIGEWLQASFTPFATWGSAAYTQVNNIVWMQIASVGGIWILSYLIYFISYQVYQFLAKGYSRERVVKIIIPLLFLSLYGTLRLTNADNQGRESITVATIGTNSTIGGPIMPPPEVRAANRQMIFDRMIKAGESGAKLIVWTEAAAGLYPSEEQAFQGYVSELTDSLNVTSIVSYVVLESADPFHYENKYILIDSTGKIQSTYHKHEPVPGEPCTKGDEPHQIYDMAGIQIGGAICYDFDFPKLTREIAYLGADLVAVPSSDWRGIDPIHSQMAIIRGVESGFSVVRSTRWGLSVIADPYGRVAGQQSDFNTENKILLADVPRKGQRTLYTLLGDWVILLSFFIVSLVFVDQWRQAR